MEVEEENEVMGGGGVKQLANIKGSKQMNYLLLFLSGKRHHVSQASPGMGGGGGGGDGGTYCIKRRPKLMWCVVEWRLISS